MKRILIIDDFFGRGVERGRNVERRSFCRRMGLMEFDASRVPENEGSQGVALVSFFRGQKPETARLGDVVENDLPGCLSRVEKGAPDGQEWDLLVVDLCFYTGEVTKESNSEFPGFPEGHPEDDNPHNFFGLKILSAARQRFPNLPVVVFSAHGGKAIQAQVKELGARRFIARDDEQARQVLMEVLKELDAEGSRQSGALEIRTVLEMARSLPAPGLRELRQLLPVLKELEAVLLLRALRGALSLYRHESEGVVLLPALRLLTGDDELTTSQAADIVKRLVHQTLPFDAMLLADDIIGEAYAKSLRLRPGRATKHTSEHD